MAAISGFASLPARGSSPVRISDDLYVMSVDVVPGEVMTFTWQLVVPEDVAGFSPALVGYTLPISGDVKISGADKTAPNFPLVSYMSPTMPDAVSGLPIGDDFFTIYVTSGDIYLRIGIVIYVNPNGAALPSYNKAGPYALSGASQSGVADTENLRGHAAESVTVFGSRNTWFDVQGGTPGGTTLDGWFAGYFAQYYAAQRAMVLSYPYFPSNAGAKGRAAYTAAGKGAYDDYWRAWSRKLRLLRKARPGLPAPIIRPGWEMNGSASYPWYIGDTDPGLYKAVWQRLIAILRADHGDAPICWCTLKGNHLPNKTSVYYPGDAWVDLVGVDYYANSMNPVPTSAAAFAAYAALGSADDPKGLYQWLAFAQKRGKKLCLPEWGIALASGDLDGAHGDVPEFVQGMWEFIAANQGKIAFENCFNQGRNFLSPSEAPKSRQRYQALWSQLDAARSMKSNSKPPAPTPTSSSKIPLTKSNKEPGKSNLIQQIGKKAQQKKKPY